MTTAKAHHVVHESETQRQHVRVRIPARLDVLGRDGRHNRYLVEDLSAGGLGLSAEGVQFKAGTVIKGTLSLSCDGIGFSIPVRCRVIRSDGERCACEFVELGAQEIASLRQIITGHLSGELVAVGDVLHALKRNNHDLARKPKRKASNAPKTLGAMIGSAASLTIGLVAFLFVASQLYGLLFVTNSSTARVESASYQISMPREGTFRTLVNEGSVVEKGAPLATFETAMLEIVRSEALAANLSPERIDELLNESVQGTVTSPCHCRIQRQFVGDGQFVSKGEPTYNLVALDQEPRVIARFGYKRLRELKPGREVRVHVAGLDGSLPGTIERVELVSGGSTGTDSVLQTVVATEEPLPAEFVGRPAEVTMMTPSFMPRITDVLPTMRPSLPDAMAAEE